MPFSASDGAVGASRAVTGSAVASLLSAAWSGGRSSEETAFPSTEATALLAALVAAALATVGSTLARFARVANPAGEIAAGAAFESPGVEDEGEPGLFAGGCVGVGAGSV